MNESLFIYVVIVGEIVVVAAFIWLWLEICWEKKHLYWRRPVLMKSWTHQKWKGYRFRRNQLKEEESDFAIGVKRADREQELLRPIEDQSHA